MKSALIAILLLAALVISSDCVKAHNLQGDTYASLSDTLSAQYQLLNSDSDIQQQNELLLLKLESIEAQLHVSTSINSVNLTNRHPRTKKLVLDQLDRKTLKKRLDKNINKLEYLLTSGKLFKKSKSRMDMNSFMQSKILGKTLEKALNLTKNPHASRFLAKLQSGIETFYNRVLANPSCRSTLESFLNGTRFSPMIDSVLSPDQKAAMLKDVVAVSSNNHDHALIKRSLFNPAPVVTIATLILLILILGPFGFFVPLIALGVIATVFFISLMLSLIDFWNHY